MPSAVLSLRRPTRVGERRGRRSRRCCPSRSASAPRQSNRNQAVDRTVTTRTSSNCASCRASRSVNASASGLAA
jgi:polyferredoxin